MIFLTVGTLFPFDRLVKYVDEAVGAGLIKEEIFAQIGKGAEEPKYIAYTDVLEKEKFDSYVNRASCLISHAGMGTITMSLNQGKPLLVVPRLHCYREHINDHQVGTARKFEQLGHVLAAYEADEVPEKVEQLKHFTPRKWITQTEKVVERIKRFLYELKE